jgi:DNA gyrase subunit A
MVAPEDDVFLISDAGVVIRTPVSEVRETGRDALGVKVMRLDSETRVAAIARVIAEDDEGVDEESDTTE